MKSITLSEGLNQEEIARKKQELEKLEQQLAENELDLSTARRELHLFENRYQRAVGSRYAELDRLKASVLEMATRIHPESKDFRSQAEAAREQANQSAHNWEVRQEESDLELPEPSEELKKMFRDAAKRIHPDLTTDPEERERRPRFRLPHSVVSWMAPHNAPANHRKDGWLTRSWTSTGLRTNAARSLDMTPANHE